MITAVKPLKHTDLIQYNWYKYALKGFTARQRQAYARNVRYYAQLVRATPSWADLTAVLDIYLCAALIRRQGGDVEVDHIVPVNHCYVCGLHCEDNLRICDRHVNHAKSNHHWPGMWGEDDQLELF